MFSLPEWIYKAPRDKDKELQEAKDNLSMNMVTKFELTQKLNDNKHYCGWFPDDRRYDEDMLVWAIEGVTIYRDLVRVLEDERKNTDTDGGRDE